MAEALQVPDPVCVLYRIDFILHRFRRVERWTGFTFAPSPEEAKQKVRNTWRIGEVLYKLSAIPVSDLAPIVTWKEEKLSPSTLIDKWVCTGYKLKYLY